MTQPDDTQQQDQQSLSAQEKTVAAVAAAALLVWLTAVAAAVVTAAGINLIALFGATLIWRKGVERIIAACARATGTTDPGYWDQVRRHLLAIPDETFTQLQTLIQDSVNRGDTPAQTQELVRQWLNFTESPHNWRYQAERIAVTETNAAHSAAQLQDAAAAGYRVKTWDTKHDDRVRNAHRRTQGQTVPIQQPYLVDGWPAMHPGDPNLPANLRIWCRCKSLFGRRKR